MSVSEILSIWDRKTQGRIIQRFFIPFRLGSPSLAEPLSPKEKTSVFFGRDDPEGDGENLKRLK